MGLVALASFVAGAVVAWLSIFVLVVADDGERRR